MKKFYLTLLLTARMTESIAGGIPVFDAASVVQAITAVQELKSQVEQQKQLYSALNGNRGMGTLLNNPALRNYLPDDWRQVYDTLNRGDVAGLTGTAAQIRKANQIFDCAKVQNAQDKLLCNRSAGLSAAQKSFGLNAYDQSTKRMDQIESLMKQINQTSDAKSIAELNARLQAENAMIQNEQIKLQMFSELSRAEENLLKQQQREQAMADAHRTPGTTFNLKKYF
jgi:type IV secretion system protein VirB5